MVQIKFLNEQSGCYSIHLARILTMEIFRKSIISGKTHSQDIPITEQQLNEYLSGNRCIQDVFPFLTAQDREFIMTGITDKEWNEIFSVED